MPLFLQTDTNPGEAEWAAASGGSGDSLLQIIQVEGTGTVAAPAIDPDGRRNISYTAGNGVTRINVTLPAITSSLGPIWRFTLEPFDFDDLTQVYVALTPDGTDTFVNLPDGEIWFLYAGGAGTSSPDPASATLVHDGESMWAVFVGGGSLVVPP